MYLNGVEWSWSESNRVESNFNLLQVELIFIIESIWMLEWIWMDFESSWIKVESNWIKWNQVESSSQHNE